MTTYFTERSNWYVLVVVTSPQEDEFGRSVVVRWWYIAKARSHRRKNKYGPQDVWVHVLARTVTLVASAHGSVCTVVLPVTLAGTGRMACGGGVLR